MTTGKAITAIADNLKTHPVAFAIIVINALFLIAGVWVMGEVAGNERARTEALNALLNKCVEKAERSNVR